jgi:hypothetical protein
MVDSVCGLTRGQVMSPWSDTADSWHYPGQFLNRSALTEFLKATKLRYLEVSIGYIAIIIEKNLYLTVSLESGYRVDTNLFHSISSPE